jgi:hypothetical protein
LIGLGEVWPNSFPLIFNFYVKLILKRAVSIGQSLQ